MQAATRRPWITRRSVIGWGFVLGWLAIGLQPVSARDPQNLSAAIGACMQGFVDQQQISGAVTVVGRADAILGFAATGKRDLETNQPMTADTLFRIASMTKPVTALGIMLLVDEGKLSIDDPVEKHLPEFRGQMLVESRGKDTVTLKKPPRPITVRDLLTHTSGLPSAYPEGLRDLYMKRNRNLAEAIMAQSQRPLDFEPGSKWSYCNAGIDTLGRIIEVLAQQPYEDFLRRRVFEPLKMTDTTFYPSAEQLARSARLYNVKEGKLQPVVDSLLTCVPGARFPIPAGGLYATGGDLARFYQMFLRRGMCNGQRLISEASLDAMTRLQTGDLKCGFVDGMGFGLGVGYVRQPQGVTEMLSPGTFGHGGAFGTQGWIDPQQGLFVVMLIQRTGLSNGDASEMRRQFQKVAIEGARAAKP